MFGKEKKKKQNNGLHLKILVPASPGTLGGV